MNKIKRYIAHLLRGVIAEAVMDYVIEDAKKMVGDPRYDINRKAYLALKLHKRDFVKSIIKRL
jgi:hypothetical protein